MVKAMEHDSSSAMATTAGKAGIGAALGLLVSMAAGAALTAGAVILGASLIGTIATAINSTNGFGWMVAEGLTKLSASSMLSSAGGAITTIAGIAGAVGGVAFGSVPAAIGGLFGAAKGSSQANRENSAFEREADRVAGTHSKKKMEYGTKKYLAGYIDGANEVGQIREQIGMQKGAQAVIEQMTAMQSGQAPVAGAELGAVGGAAGIAGAGALSMTADGAGAAAGGAVAASADGKSFSAAICKCDSTVDAIKTRRDSQALSNELS